MIQLPVEMVFATILISFLTFICGCAAGGLIIAMVIQLQNFFRHRVKMEIPDKMVKRGIMLGATNIIFGFFMAYRIGHLLTTSSDFEPKDWLLYDLGVGIYMFVMSLFLLSILTEVKKLNPPDSPPGK